MAGTVFSFGSSILLLLLIFLFSNHIIHWIYFLFSFNPEHIIFSKSIDKNYLYLIPLGAFFIAIYQILIHWITRQKKFLNLSINRIIKESTMGLTQLGMGAINTLSIGLIAGQIIGNIMASIMLLINTFQTFKIKYICSLNPTSAYIVKISAPCNNFIINNTHIFFKSHNICN